MKQGPISRYGSLSLSFIFYFGSPRRGRLFVPVLGLGLTQLSFVAEDLIDHFGRLIHRLLGRLLA